MSKQQRIGQDINAYTRILKFQNKRFGVTPKDYVVYFGSIIITVLMANYFENQTHADYGGIFYFIYSIFMIISVLAFIDYTSGIGMFKEKGVFYMFKDKGEEHHKPEGIAVELVDVIIRALASRNKVDILSSPRILTLDNEEAIIKVGTKDDF